MLSGVGCRGRGLRFEDSGNLTLNDTISKCGENDRQWLRVEVYGVRLEAAP